MSLDIYINDELLDLDSDKGIGLTFQIGSVLNPGNRAGNLSNKFNAPKTKRNTEILSNLSNINSVTNLPYERNSGKIIQDGIEIFPDGFAIIESTGSDYSITIYSGNVSFFDLIKGRNVNELDWLLSCHDWTIANIIASFSNTDNYIYPMVDWGFNVQLLNNTITQNADAIIPVLYIKDVITKMASNVGYEVKGTFPLSSEWQRLILTPNQFGYSEDVVNNVTGFMDTVSVIPSTPLDVLSICNSTGAALFQNIIIFLTNIQGALFSQTLLAPRFIPDNYYLGNFTLNAQGFFSGYVPTLGEHIYNNGNRDYNHANINETHLSWMHRRPGFSEQLIFVQNIESGSPIQLSTNANGATASIVSMTETLGGYVAWSISNNPVELNLYDITLATSSVIYSNAGASSELVYLKIWNGRIVFRDITVGGGLFMYDISSGTTKTIQLGTGGAIGTILDHNGNYCVWEDPVANDINIFDYVAGTNTLIQNGGGFSGMSTCKVLGDYATYWDTSLDKMVSYKISTSTLTNILIDPTDSCRQQARTLTKLSFGTNNGDLHYYDLITNTLTTIGAVTDFSGGAVSQVDRFISMNEDNIAFIRNNADDVSFYNIVSTVITLIQSQTSNLDWVIIGKSNVVTYHRILPLARVQTYRIDTASIIVTANNVPNNFNVLGKAYTNDRFIFTADQGLSSSPLDRVSTIEPIFNPISVDLTLVIKEDGNIIYSVTDNHLITFNGAYNLYLNPTSVYVKSGSVYTAELFIDADRDETINFGLDYSLTISSFSFSASNSIPYLAKLDMATFYNIEQEKILTDIMNQYSLTIQTDEVTKQVFLTPLDELNNNLSQSINWNEKINLETIPNVKYQLGSYGQKNYFRYAEDEDVITDTGIGSFDVADENLPLVKDVIKLNATGVVADLRLANEHTPTIPFITAINNNFFDQKKSRILLLDKITKTINWQNTVNSDTGISTTLPLSYFNKSGKNDNLDFESLLQNNYSVLRGMLNQVKFISAGFRLTEVDIANLDFTIPIYLDVHISDIHINGYFYINKISNFKRNETTKVDLIRL